MFPRAYGGAGDGCVSAVTYIERTCFDLLASWCSNARLIHVGAKGFAHQKEDVKHESPKQRGQPHLDSSATLWSTTEFINTLTSKLLELKTGTVQQGGAFCFSV